MAERTVALLPLKVTFGECLAHAFASGTLVAEYDRVNGTTLGKGDPVSRLIGLMTRRPDPEMDDFVAFVRERIWSRIPEEERSGPADYPKVPDPGEAGPVADAVAILDGRPVTEAEVDALVAGLMGDIFGPLSPEEEREALRILAVEDLMRPQLPPAYSTDIAAAWRVVTERAGWLPSLTWQCGIFRGDDIGRMGWFCDFRSADHHGYAAADTAPLAIALAALLAAGACKTATAILPDCVRPGGAA